MKFLRTVLFFVIIVLMITSCKPIEYATTVSDTVHQPTIKPFQNPNTQTPYILTQILLDTPENEKVIKVLFIGNSYTYYNDLPGTFEKLMLSGGYEIEVGQSTSGGWSLSNHLTASETLTKIAGTDWDYIILQEQSSVTNVKNGMFPAIRELHKKISSVGAETVLFMTWGRRDGLPSAGFQDYSAVQAQVAANYLEIGQELGVKVVPVGLAWQVALSQDTSLDLWDADGSHPNKTGSYLAACVFYTVLTGKSPEGLLYTTQLPQETAHFLQRVASDTVHGFVH
jgi:hypothetical protein